MTAPASWEYYYLDFSQRAVLRVQIWILPVFHRWRYQHLLKSYDLMVLTARATRSWHIPWNSFKKMCLLSTFGDCGSNIREKTNICQDTWSFCNITCPTWVKLSQVGLHQMENHKRFFICVFTRIRYLKYDRYYKSEQRRNKNWADKGAANQFRDGLPTRAD